MKTIKLLMLIICMVISIGASAGYIPIPIPINYSGGGNITFKEGISILIVLNTIFLLILIVRTIMYFITKPKCTTWFEYVIWSDAEYLIVDLNIALFGVLNGVCIVAYLIVLVSKVI